MHLFKKNCWRRHRSCTRLHREQLIMRWGTRTCTRNNTWKTYRRIVGLCLNSHLKRDWPRQVMLTLKTTRSKGPRAAWTKPTIYSVFLFQGLRRDISNYSSISISQTRIYRIPTSPAWALLSHPKQLKPSNQNSQLSSRPKKGERRAAYKRLTS